MSQYGISLTLESKKEYDLQLYCDSKEFLEKICLMLSQLKKDYNGDIIIKEVI